LEKKKKLRKLSKQKGRLSDNLILTVKLKEKEIPFHFLSKSLSRKKCVPQNKLKHVSVA
jgi:hypothetical protein